MSAWAAVLTAGRYDDQRCNAPAGYPADMGPDELLPEQTRDDVDTDDTSDTDHEAWLRDQVPPHYGE